MRTSLVCRRTIGFAILGSLVGVCVAVARADSPSKAGAVPLNAVLNNNPSVPDLGSQQDTPVVRVGLTPKTAKQGSIVTVSVTVSLPPNTYTYSTTPTVPGATSIELNDLAGLEPLADSAFEPDREPKVVTDPSSGKAIEKFERVVTWLRPY